MEELNQAAVEFIENMGLSAEADGLPRIAGRMWGFFVIQGGPCSFAEVADMLQVSRGSVSTNARLLRALGILQRVSRPGDRQDYYQLSDNPYESLLSGYVERMSSSGSNAEAALSRLPAGHGAAKQRLREMRNFYRTATTWTQQLIDDMRSQDGAATRAKK